MIGSVMSDYRANFLYSNVNKKTESADASFGETLAEMTEADVLMAKAPDKWVTEPGIAHNTVCAAVKYRESELGIKVTEPAHELTSAQREWLCSRHDFSTMKTHIRYSYEYEGTTQYRSKATPEYSNLLADLAYLGIYSADEFIMFSPLDTRPGAYSTLTEYANELWNSDCSLSNTAKMVVKHLENMFEFYNSRSEDPHAAVEGDTEFARLIKEHFLPLPKLFSEMIEDLFGNENAELPRSSAVPPIEDASGKLKEDFGRALA